PDAAVAHDHRGDAVPARRRDLGIPGDLAVVVSVDVDPSGRDDKAVGVELAPAALVDRTNRSDDSVVDGDVSASRRGPGAVDDRSAPAYDVMHAFGLAGEPARRPKNVRSKGGVLGGIGGGRARAGRAG